MMQEAFRPILEELEAGRSAVLHRTVDGVEYTRLFRPRERLILLGGGHIAQPLCRMAAMLDFDVTVVDDRPDFAAAAAAHGQACVRTPEKCSKRDTFRWGKTLHKAEISCFCRPKSRFFLLS